jgi:hypothetical protein
MFCRSYYGGKGNRLSKCRTESGSSGCRLVITHLTYIVSELLLIFLLFDYFLFVFILPS